VKTPLIDERDQYLMSKIEEAPGEKIVAVVGAGHVNGMQTYFGKTVDRTAIEQLPKPSKWLKVFKWIVPLFILALFAKGYYATQGQSLEEMLYALIIPNATGAFVFCLLAGSRLLTAIVTAFAAPITTLNPAIGAGMVSGLMEAYLRKPKVECFEKLPQDIQTWKGFYRNDVTRVLLVFAGGMLGSALGTFISIGWLTSLFV
jgi:pheromone shutdown protein TraB